MTVWPPGRVVLASGNAGKLAEIRALLAGSGLELVPQSDFDVPEVEETGTTFVENAICLLYTSDAADE